MGERGNAYINLARKLLLSVLLEYRAGNSKKTLREILEREIVMFGSALNELRFCLISSVYIVFVELLRYGISVSYCFLETFHINERAFHHKCYFK
jgi:hypothetical protein